MKAKNLFFGALTCLAFAACSNEDEPIVNGGGTEISGDKFIALAISMPDKGATTRVFSENTDLDDGLAAEYVVKDATLLIFSGTDETSEDNKCVEVVNLSTEPWTNKGDSPNQITSNSTKVIAKVNNATSTSGALVVLNKGDLNLENYKDKSFSGVLQEVTTTGKKAEDYASTTNGFLMVNAPLASVVGGADYAGNVTTLRPITQVYSSYAEASASTVVADEIYVERAVVKVTLQNSASGNLVSDKSLAWTLQGWAISKKAESSYVVRNTSDSDMDVWGKYAAQQVSSDYRFIGTTPVATDLYRTYFAKDVNYENESVLEDISDASLVTNFGNENPQYCFENTFSVANMLKKYTTNVVLKVKIGDGSTDYYILNGSNSVVYTETTLKELAYGKMVAAVTESVIKDGLTSGQELGYTDFSIVIADNVISGTEGYLSIKSMTLTDAGKEKYSSPDKATAVETAIANTLSGVNKDLQSNVTLTKYDNGICYYAARIKHFDESTPWSSEGKTVAYGSGTDADRDYLGRYGVLRNNWYDLSISKITNIGSAELPAFTNSSDGGDETDDDIESYVVLKINILSWAKRSQEVEL